MAKQIIASHIMTNKVVVASLTNTFEQLMEFFTLHKIQHLPVTFDDKLLGIISVNDMLAFVGKELKKGTAPAVIPSVFKIEKAMTHNPTTVSPNESVDVVLEILSEGKFQALPVVEDGIIRGIITNKDLVRIYKWEREQ